MEINIKKLKNITVSKTNRCIDRLETLKMYTEEYQETLYAVMKSLEVYKELETYDVECPECNKKEEPLFGNAVIAFLDEGCGPCEQMKSLLDIVDFSNVELIKYFTDTNREEFEKNNIHSFPVLHFIKNGELVHTLEGYDTNSSVEQNKEFLENIINNIYGGE